MRGDSEIAIWVDVLAALSDGVPFYRSGNGVICSPGIDGVVGAQYFAEIWDLESQQAKRANSFHGVDVS
jgi:2'-phosphotransferase